MKKAVAAAALLAVLACTACATVEPIDHRLPSASKLTSLPAPDDTDTVGSASADAESTEPEKPSRFPVPLELFVHR